MELRGLFDYIRMCMSFKDWAQTSKGEAANCSGETHCEINTITEQSA